MGIFLYLYNSSHLSINKKFVSLGTLRVRQTQIIGVGNPVLELRELLMEADFYGWSDDSYSIMLAFNSDGTCEGINREMYILKKYLRYSICVKKEM